MLSLLLLLQVAAPGVGGRIPPRPPVAAIIDCLPGPWIVFFPRNSATLDAEAAAILDHALKIDGSACGDAVFTLAGHLDRGERDGVDRRRAVAVSAYLHRHGVPNARLRVEAMGSRIPLVAGARAASTSQNRRVELTVGPPRD